MSGIITCEKCGEIVGSMSYRKKIEFDSTLHEYTPKGKCDHPEPETGSVNFFFNLISLKWIRYTETNTSNSWYEYIGPINKILIFLSMVRIQERSIFIKGKTWFHLGISDINDPDYK